MATTEKKIRVPFYGWLEFVPRKDFQNGPWTYEETYYEPEEVDIIRNTKTGEYAYTNL